MMEMNIALPCLAFAFPRLQLGDFAKVVESSRFLPWTIFGCKVSRPKHGAESSRTDRFVEFPAAFETGRAVAALGSLPLSCQAGLPSRNDEDTCVGPHRTHTHDRGLPHVRIVHDEAHTTDAPLGARRSFAVHSSARGSAIDPHDGRRGQWDFHARRDHRPHAR